MTTHPDAVMTPGQLVAMYSRYPQALAEELDFVLGEARNEHDMTIHNHVIRKIERMCPQRDQLILRVVQAILETATQTGAITDGKERSPAERNPPE